MTEVSSHKGVTDVNGFRTAQRDHAETSPPEGCLVVTGELIK